MIQRDLFDTQMQIGDQLIDQKSQPFHPDSKPATSQKAIAKFRATENAVEYRKKTFNRTDDQQAYIARVNKKKTTHNILYSDESWLTVSKATYDGYDLPEQPERDYYQAI